MDQKQLGERLRRRRETLGLKQSEAAEQAEIGQQHVSTIERGGSTSLATMSRYAGVLGFEVGLTLRSSR